jgi:hypothetical protein
MTRPSSYPAINAALAGAALAAGCGSPIRAVGAETEEMT